MISKKKLGAIIEMLRNHRGMSQEQLAEATNTSKDTIVKLERGEIYPSFDFIDCMVNDLNVDANILIPTDRNENLLPDMLFWDLQKQLSSEEREVIMNFHKDLLQLFDSANNSMTIDSEN